MAQATQRYSGLEANQAGPGLDTRWPASAIWRDGEPAVRRIGVRDLIDSVLKGIDDFKAVPTHLVFLACIYPAVGLILGRLYLGTDVLALAYPAFAGLALIGPVLAIGLYEISRRRELGLPVSIWNGLDVFTSPSRGALLRLSLLLAGLFFEWLAMAWVMARSLIGPAPASLQDFMHKVLETSQGHQLIVTGHLLGLIFAAAVLAISVISFPMLVDRNTGAAVAVRTSIRACIENPVVMALWGLFVATSLLIGTLMLFAGLAVILPVLGHATWHLYRASVER